MFKPLLLPAALLGFVFMLAAQAADTTRSPTQPAPKKTQAREQIYGSQLMTAPERDAYRAKMRGAKTQAERDQIRAEHHAAMRERAKEKGVTLPAEPREGRGAGLGKGAGPRPNR